jgi:hypothetical protein
MLTMPAIARSAADMIGGMNPVLLPGCYLFHTTVDPAEARHLRPDALAVFEEDEGTSLILPAPDDHPGAMRRITLMVHSSLDGVGLTAAVSGASAAQGIACNMVAAFHHDHVFVPASQAQDAMAVLRALQADGA